MLVLEEEV